MVNKGRKKGYLARFRGDSRSVELPTTEGPLIGSKITSTCFLDDLRTLLPRSLNSQTRNCTPSLFYKMDRFSHELSSLIYPAPACQGQLSTLVFKLSSSIKCIFLFLFLYVQIDMCQELNATFERLFKVRQNKVSLRVNVANEYLISIILQIVSNRFSPQLFGYLSTLYQSCFDTLYIL